MSVLEQVREPVIDLAAEACWLAREAHRIMVGSSEPGAGHDLLARLRRLELILDEDTSTQQPLREWLAVLRERVLGFRRSSSIA